MNTTKFISTAVFSALILTTATSAFADDKWVGEEGSNWKEHATQSKSSTSREQVQDVTVAAARRGEITYGDEPRYPKSVSTTARSRADVHAEAVRSTHSGRGVYNGG